jgi:hypothetical protein
MRAPRKSEERSSEDLTATMVVIGSARHRLQM